jgi:predicted YcjX-like family ATPase
LTLIVEDRAPAPTLVEYAKQSFVPHIVARKSEKPKPLALYRNNVTNLPAFERLANARLDRIDVPLIDAFIACRRELAKRVSAMNRELATLLRMFNLLPARTAVNTLFSPEEDKLYLAAAPGVAHPNSSAPRSANLLKRLSSPLRGDPRNGHSKPPLPPDNPRIAPSTETRR